MEDICLYAWKKDRLISCPLSSLTNSKLQQDRIPRLNFGRLRQFIYFLVFPLSCCHHHSSTNLMIFVSISSSKSSDTYICLFNIDDCSKTAVTHDYKIYHSFRSSWHWRWIDVKWRVYLVFGRSYALDIISFLRMASRWVVVSTSDSVLKVILSSCKEETSDWTPLKFGYVII